VNNPTAQIGNVIDSVEQNQKLSQIEKLDDEYADMILDSSLSEDFLEEIQSDDTNKSDDINDS
jgi:hypothetical protein